MNRNKRTAAAVVILLAIFTGSGLRLLRKPIAETRDINHAAYHRPEPAGWVFGRLVGAPQVKYLDPPVQQFQKPGHLR